MNFYEENVSKIFINQSHQNRFEESLVDKDGFRNRIKMKALSDISFEKNYCEALENLHIIRTDKYNDEEYVELIHDRVADAIKERRKIAKKKRQAKGWYYFWAAVTIVLALWAIRVITVSPSKPINYKSNVTEYLNLTVTSDDTLAFCKRKGKVEDNHIVERLIINDTTAIEINACSYLKELIVEPTKGGETINISLSDCPQLRNIVIPDSTKDLTYSIKNCPNLKLPIGPKVENLSININGSECTFSIVVNNSYFSWEEAVPYLSESVNNKKKSPKDSTSSKYNYTLWDKRNGKLLYAQQDVPEELYFPRYSSNNNWGAIRIGDRLFQNMDGNRVQTEIQNDTISKEIIHFEDVKNSEAEYIFLTDSVKYIYPNAFAKCKRLKRIRLSPNIDGIYEKAFQGCSLLDSIVLPDSLTFLSDLAFEGCDNLHYVIFMNTKKLYLGEGVFANCKNLETIELCGNISTQYRQNDGISFFSNPFFECKKLKNIIIKDKGTCPFSIKGNIVFAKDDNKPLFITGSHCDYKDDRFYSVDGSLLEKNEKYRSHIWFLADKKHLALSNFFQESKSCHFCCFISADNKLYTYVIHDKLSKELDLPIDVGRAAVQFVYRPDSLRTIRIRYAQPANMKYALSFNIPDSLKQNIEIIVPHGCSKYYINNPSFINFKEIKEESYLSSQLAVLSFFTKTTIEFLKSHWWGLPAFCLGCFLFAYLIYYFRKKNLIKHNKVINNVELCVFAGKTVIIALLLYTIFYWISVGYWPGNELSNNLFAIILSVFYSLIMMLGKNGIMEFISKIHHTIIIIKQTIGHRKNAIQVKMHSETWKRTYDSVIRNTIIWLSFIAASCILIVAYLQMNDIESLIDRKDYKRAFYLIYKQALRNDSLSTSLQEQMRNILIAECSTEGLADSTSIHGLIKAIHEYQGYICISQGDSIITYDIKNRKRYATMEQYSLSKQGKVLYKNTDDDYTFIPTNNQSLKLSINFKIRDWRFLDSERFVALRTDTLLYLYDLQDSLACKVFSKKSGNVYFGSGKSDKYFALSDNTGKTIIYTLPDFIEQPLNYPFSLEDFFGDKVIMERFDWGGGKTYFASINDNMQITNDYYGNYCSLSNDDKSFLITTDSVYLYWYSLDENDPFTGSVARKDLGFGKHLIFDSERCMFLLEGNKSILDFIITYQIPKEYGNAMGVINNNLVYHNDSMHITRIIDPSQSDPKPLVIMNAWPHMFKSGNKSYLSISNKADYWRCDSIVIYNGQTPIVVGPYQNMKYENASGYVIIGDYHSPKLIYSLNDAQQAPREIGLVDYSTHRLYVLNGWLFAENNSNIKVYNIQTLPDLIRSCNYYDEVQKNEIISILTKE